MAPLYEFDGSRWRAFGPPHGLKVKYALPELDGRGRITVDTPKGYLAPKGKTWEHIEEMDALSGKRWISRKLPRNYSWGTGLLFRDGEQLVEVQPIAAQTGVVWDMRSEKFFLWAIAEDPSRDCVWLGTRRGLYRIWREEPAR
jgi:hypothetical protein